MLAFDGDLPHLLVGLARFPIQNLMIGVGELLWQVEAEAVIDFFAFGEVGVVGLVLNLDAVQVVAFSARAPLLRGGGCPPPEPRSL